MHVAVSQLVSKSRKLFSADLFPHRHHPRLIVDWTQSLPSHFLSLSLSVHLFFLFLFGR